VLLIARDRRKMIARLESIVAKLVVIAALDGDPAGRDGEEGGVGSCISRGVTPSAVP
jgi:hypothetical protein